MNCYWFLYLQSRFIYRFYKATRHEFRGVPATTFSFNKLSVNNIAKIVDDSHIILDIQHPRQNGLTMRTIEMVGMNKKMITTNAGIKEYDFYNPNNILVVDRENVQVDMDFLKRNYEPVNEAVYERYSIKSWILEVLS